MPLNYSDCPYPWLSTTFSKSSQGPAGHRPRPHLRRKRHVPRQSRSRQDAGRAQKGPGRRSASRTQIGARTRGGKARFSNSNPISTLKTGPTGAPQHLALQFRPRIHRLLRRHRRSGPSKSGLAPAATKESLRSAGNLVSENESEGVAAPRITSRLLKNESYVERGLGVPFCPTHGILIQCWPLVSRERVDRDEKIALRLVAAFSLDQGLHFIFRIHTGSTQLERATPAAVVSRLRERKKQEQCIRWYKKSQRQGKP